MLPIWLTTLSPAPLPHSWPLALLGKMIPVPETPLSRFFTRAFRRRRTSRSKDLFLFFHVSFILFYFLSYVYYHFYLVHWLFLLQAFVLWCSPFPLLNFQISPWEKKSMHRTKTCFCSGICEPLHMLQQLLLTPY